MKNLRNGLLLSLSLGAFGLQGGEASAGVCEKSVKPLLTAMFSSLGNDCEIYAALYTEDAKYYHQHQGFKTGSELFETCQGYGSFCRDDGNECLFLQDAEEVVVERDGECHILAPYIWSQIPANNKIPNNLEPHTGWEYVIAKPDRFAQFGYKIRYFAEVETSYSIPYNWASPAENSALFADSTLKLLEIERAKGIYKGECDQPLAPFLTSYFENMSSSSSLYRQQGDAVVLGVDGLCQVTAPYAAQVGSKLKSGKMQFILKLGANGTYQKLDAVDFGSFKN